MTSTLVTQRPSSGTPARPVWTYRIVATLAAVLLFIQSILAGQFIADKHDKIAFELHRDNAIISVVVVLVLVVAAILTVWPGGGRKTVFPRAVGLLVVTAGEAAAGFAKLPALHVPLGVALIGIAAWMAVSSWRRTA